ncbi:MAG: 1-acyl-sn-glycerol-3-phosphate acyltransferase [Gemmatimonadetes bacterium]|jgi:1-acyl-sn-glycerol-3-phosphate acyltransferase|nr:1-acyl-sn-glycerol-3-phosphate acyltransferase [Gemmatimonadota bacterium]
MRTILTAATVWFATILLAPIAVAARMLGLDEEQYGIAQWCMRTWAKSMCMAAGVKVVVHNPERILTARGAVYASNHVSWFDVFAIASVLPRYTFIAKSELRKLPIFGYGAEAAGVVFLARDNRKAAFESYQGAAKEVTAGKNVVVFPEGTRGRDYSLRPFKKGPFVLAIAAQAPVVPVLVYGAREVMPKGSMRVRSNTVHVHFLEPVETTGFTYDRRHQLMRVVWGRIEECLRNEYGIGTSEHPIAESSGEQIA